jgi:ubiquinone biosynthesis protein COQ4
MTFQRLGFLGRSILTVSASIMAITNPTRADLVATVGELTGVEALRKLRDRLSRTPQGREILKQRPRIEQTICREKLAQLEPNTFGYRYEMFLARHQFSPLERPIVRFIQDEELAYIMQRYREVHDFWHVLLEIPPTVQGEVILKWFEGFHTGLPFCFLAGCTSPFLLSPQQQWKLVQHDIPWAFHTARNCVDLLSVEYEKLLDRDFFQVQKQLALVSFPQENK